LIKSLSFIVSNDSGEVYCLDLIKRGIKWSLVFENQIFAKNPIIFESTPIVIDETGVLFVSSNYGFTHSIKVETGSINWSVPLMTIRRLFINGNSIFMIHKNRFLVIDKSKGTILYNKRFSSSKKKSGLFFKDILINRSEIHLLTNSGEAIKVNNKNFNDIQRVKLPSKYEDFLLDNNNILLKTKNSIIKF
jgi:outer membrane protein assembly factor BamB